MAQQRFDFHPPFRMDYIDSVKREVLSSVPVHEIDIREYLLSCLNSLVEYAIEEKKQTQNFSLNVAFFDPHFDPHNEEKIWSKHNIWVKIKVAGGLGLVFRNRYMANQKGVARVDWKRKTYRVAKIFTVKALLKGAEHAMKATGTPQGHWNAKKVEYQGRKIVNKLNQEQEDRSSDRLHKVHYTLAGMITLLKKMPSAEFREISRSDGLEDLTEHTFELLDADHDMFLRQAEFVSFLTDLMNVPEDYAKERFQQGAHGDNIMNLKEFASVFREVMHSITSNNPA